MYTDCNVLEKFKKKLFFKCFCFYFDVHVTERISPAHDDNIYNSQKVENYFKFKAEVKFQIRFDKKKKGVIFKQMMV